MRSRMKGASASVPLWSSFAASAEVELKQAASPVENVSVYIYASRVHGDVGGNTLPKRGFTDGQRTTRIHRQITRIREAGVPLPAGARRRWRGFRATTVRAHALLRSFAIIHLHFRACAAHDTDDTVDIDDGKVRAQPRVRQA
jgi:hypothetical protein